MKQKISVVTLGVADLNRSKKFYEGILGFNPEKESNEHIIFYNLEGTWLALFPASELANDAGVSSEGNGFKKFSLAHNEPSREAVDALFNHLIANDVTIVKRPQEVFWGGYSGYFADPDGNLWEVAHNPLMDLT
jgi:hypothetical protein